MSAWTKVVGYGLFGSDLVMGGFGVVGVGGGCDEGRLTPLLGLLLLVELLLLWVLGDGRRDWGYDS